MGDEKGDGLTPIEDYPLFAEALRRFAPKTEEEKREIERKNAGKVVVQWLEEVKKKEEIKPGVTLQKMAEGVLGGLKEGRILFAVRSPGKMKEPVEARSIKVIFQKERRYGTVVVLEVEKGIELLKLNTSQGVEQLRELYYYDQSITEKRGRIKAEYLTRVNIKDPDIGPFPKLE